MDILIESTKQFERDLNQLSAKNQSAVIEKINDFASRLITQKDSVYRQLYQRPLGFDLNGYDSSLYTFRIADEFGVILAIDEDPIFDQVVFTLFRVVDCEKFDQAYESLAESLYRDLRHQTPEIARI